MYSPDELKSLHQFIRHTGEGNLKKMMTGGRMTDVHTGLLIKVARACNEDEFATHFEAGTFPRLKFTVNESAMKESCYGVFAEACAKLGLMTAPAKVAKAA